MRPSRRQLLAGILTLLGAVHARAVPVPEAKGLYTDAEAEAFAKELSKLEVRYPTDFHAVLKLLKIDVVRLGQVCHYPGNATDWYVYPLSGGYEIVGTQRLQSDRPEPRKGVRVDGVDIRKKSPR